MQKFVDDVRHERRPEGSIMSRITVDSLLPDEREAWRQLRKELENTGITPELFKAHQSFITKTLRDAANAGTFGGNHEECEDALSDIPSEHSSPISSRRSSIPGLRQNESLIEEESASSLLAEPDEQDKQLIFHTSDRDDQSSSWRRLEDPQERNIPVSIAQAIEEGDYIKLERTSSDRSDASLRSNGVPLLAIPASAIGQTLTTGVTRAAVGQSDDAVLTGGGQDNKLASYNDPGFPGPSKTIRHTVPSLRMEVKSELKAARPSRTTKLLNVVFKRDKDLLKAAFHGDQDHILSLLEKGVDVRAKDAASSTAVHVASRWGYRDIVKLLLEEGAPLEQTNNAGHTALYHASYGGHVEVVKLLLDKGANINNCAFYSNVPLIAARKGGHRDIVKLLLENRAYDPELLSACREGRTDQVQFLLREGTNIESVDPGINFNPLVAASRVRQSDTLTVLFEQEANDGAFWIDGKTPLMTASRYGHGAVVDLLLQHGANTEARDRNGRTALFLACWFMHFEAGEMLLHYGADIATRDNNGQTALMAVAQSSSRQRFDSRAGQDAAKLVKVLLERGANVNEKDHNGRTALIKAAEMEFSQSITSAWVIPLLLKYGARVDDQDNGGTTALDMARRCGNSEAVDLLKIYGGPERAYLRR